MKAIRFDGIIEKMKDIDYKRHVAYVNKKRSMFYVVIEEKKELTYPETDRGKAIFIVIEGKGNIELSEDKREHYKKGDILIIDGKEKKKFFADERTVMVEIRDIIL